MSNIGSTNVAAASAAYEKDLSVSAEFYDFRKGDNYLRVLPGIPEISPIPYQTRKTHWRVGPEQKILDCPRSFDPEAECFLCLTVETLSESADSNDQAIAADIEASSVWLYNVVDLDNLRAGIQVMRAGWQIHKGLKKLFTSKSYGDITDPDAGFNITIEQEKKGKKITYTVMPDREPSALPDEVFAWFEAEKDPRVDLRKLVRPASSGRMEAAFNGDDDPEEEEEPAVEREPQSRVRRNGNGASRPRAAVAAEAPAAEDDEPEDLPFEEDGDDGEAPAVADEPAVAEAPTARPARPARQAAPAPARQQSRPVPPTRPAVGSRLGSRPRAR